MAEPTQHGRDHIEPLGLLVAISTTVLSNNSGHNNARKFTSNVLYYEVGVYAYLMTIRYFVASNLES